MITTCTECGQAYEAGSQEQAYEPKRYCPECWRAKAEKANARLIAEMLEALKAQHKALDMLMAMLATRDREFMPSKSAAWPAVEQGFRAIAKAEGGA